MASPTAFKVKPHRAATEWTHRAEAHGLRVLRKEVRQGQVDYRVFDGQAAVTLRQAPEIPLPGVLDDPTVGQLVILRQLARTGVIEIVSHSA